MRPADRHTFKDQEPLQSNWIKPHITDIELSKAEVESVVSAANPQAELRKLYLVKKLEPAQR